MNKILLSLSAILLLFSCNSEENMKADLLVYHANVYTVDGNFSKANAFVVKDGRFLAVGNSDSLRTKYDTKETIDAGGKSVYPGFIDAHAHFYNLGMQQQRVDLTGTKSFAEVVAKITEFQKNKKLNLLPEGVGIRTIGRTRNFR